MDCCNLDREAEIERLRRYDTANGMDCCNRLQRTRSRSLIVTIPRTVWTVATIKGYQFEDNTAELRYRERYGLLQLGAVSVAVTIPTLLRYRERYGLLQRVEYGY